MAVLKRLHAATEHESLDVIFVHGLGGDAKLTWMNSPKDETTLWPSWIGDEVECNVWVAGYGAALSGWTDAAMPLAQQGDALFAALQVEQKLQGHKIVLIGHSLGGLVIKAGMTQAETLGDPKRMALLERIAGVVFVGTPHQGSSLATFADILRFLLRTNPQVSNMDSNDAWLKLLNDQFRALHKQRNFDVKVFFEAKGILIGRRFFFLEFGKRKLIVDQYSSDPGIAGVIPTAIEADHFGIAKPKSREAFIHKALVSFLRDLASKTSDTPKINGNRSTHLSNFADLTTKLKAASAPLLSWPSTLNDGTWLMRPELNSLVESVTSSSSSTHFLLGAPGSGKSSLLVRLAREMQDAGWSVLAIKADRLPPDVLNRDSLKKYLDFDADVRTVLQELTHTAPVLVLVDQVDALAELVVQHSARLRVLLDLVQDLDGTEGIHTVISCRTFEQKHDPALRNLEATVIQLELPEWSTVEPILTARGLQVALWNQEIQQVLRSPHALEIFLSDLGGNTEPDVLKSFHGLLEKQWQTQVLSDISGSRRATLHHLAKLMAEREVLGLPLAQVEGYYADIKTLTAVGLLRMDQGPGRVEFRHQTLYEFVRARSFLEESGSLTDTVQAQQGSLRVRPQLWHALGYFRSSSPDEYSIEIFKLWGADLRPHLKMLLIEFIGLQTVPIFAERRLVEESISDKWFRPRFIGAAVGSQGWFAILLKTHLPRLMRLPLEQAQTLLPMLRQALHFSPDEVVTLVRQHWLADKDRDMMSWQVLGGGDVAPQTGQWLDTVIQIVERSTISAWAIGHLAAVVSASQPEAAPRLIAAWFKQQLDSAEKPEVKAFLEEGEAAYPDYSAKIQSILEARHFHDMDTIAEAAPRAFVEALWPILLTGLHLVSGETSKIVLSYRHHSGLLFEDLNDNDTRIERPLVRSIQLGIQGWADTKPNDFLDFFAENELSDLLLVHRLLALGILCCVEHYPQRVFNYLCGDPRRLMLGPYSDVHKESVALIEAVCPLLDSLSYLKLEAIICSWRYYKDIVPQDDVETRQKRLHWARQHRLRLLRALPIAMRSTSIQKLLDEEERAFPGLSDKDANFSGVQCIGSPVSAEQMALATEIDILNLFNELTDDSSWDHPRRFMKGGAIQAGREFAELAKINLEKVLRIIRALDPNRNEIPVSSALLELVPAGLTASAFYELIAELEDKGFVGADFRRNAAYAITRAVKKETLVPDSLLDRMERWLVFSESECVSEDELDTKESAGPILWGHGLMRVLPAGNYPTLSAITSACLNAEPQRIDRWLSMLERHSQRLESLDVWDALIDRELRYLGAMNPSKAEPFVDKLLIRAPYLIDRSAFIRFIATTFYWASVSAVQRWLVDTFEHGRENLQGVGELSCLRYAMFPAEDWALNLVEMLCSDNSSKGALGVAYSVSNLWHKPMTRQVVHPFLLKLLQSTDEGVLTALSGIFLNDGFDADYETKELMNALVLYPKILNDGRADRLPELLVKLVTSEPKAVCSLVNVLLDTAGEQMSDIATSWYVTTEWLLDIALQLQDMGPDERVAGSELFERMLEFNIPQAREMTLDLDKRTPVIQSARAPARRRSRNKAHRSLGKPSADL